MVGVDGNDLSMIYMFSISHFRSYFLFFCSLFPGFPDFYFDLLARGLCGFMVSVCLF